MKAPPPLRAALLHPKTLLGLLLLAGISGLAFLPSEFIQARWPERPVVPDLLFELLPHVPWMAYLTDPIVIAADFLVLAYALSRARRRLPQFFFVTGLGYVLRSLIIPLTPLGRPTGNLASYGIFSAINLKQHGMFPSGHTMLAVMIFLLIDRRDAPGLKAVAGFLALGEMVTLLLSRGHYTIDVAGGVLLALAVHYALERRRAWFEIG